MVYQKDITYEFNLEFIHSKINILEPEGYTKGIANC